MRFSFDPQTEAFRAEFAAWLDEHAPDPAEATVRARSSADIPPWARRWQRKMFDAGWLVPGNPPEYGGRNANLLEEFVHLEELGRRRIYASYNPQGLAIVVPSILDFGTEEQKRRWAVPIMRAEIDRGPRHERTRGGIRPRRPAYAGGARGRPLRRQRSEDVDIGRARRRRHPVRSSAPTPKHRSTAASASLIVDMTARASTRRPFGSIVGPDDLDFNEVFFDDVEVPVENLLGRLHEGWACRQRVARRTSGQCCGSGSPSGSDDLVDHGRAALVEHGLAGDALVLDWFGKLVRRRARRSACSATARWPRRKKASSRPSNRS